MILMNSATPCARRSDPPSEAANCLKSFTFRTGSRHVAGQGNAASTLDPSRAKGFSTSSASPISSSIFSGSSRLQGDGSPPPPRCPGPSRRFGESAHEAGHLARVVLVDPVDFSCQRLHSLLHPFLVHVRHPVRRIVSATLRDREAETCLSKLRPSTPGQSGRFSVFTLREGN